MSKILADESTTPLLIFFTILQHAAYSAIKYEFKKSQGTVKGKISTLETVLPDLSPYVFRKHSVEAVDSSNVRECIM